MKKIFSIYKLLAILLFFVSVFSVSFFTSPREASAVGCNFSSINSFTVSQPTAKAGDVITLSWSVKPGCSDGVLEVAPADLRVASMSSGSSIVVVSGPPETYYLSVCNGISPGPNQGKCGVPYYNSGMQVDDFAQVTIGVPQYTFTGFPGANGTIFPSPQVVTAGGSINFTVDANLGYHVQDITGCGYNLTNVGVQTYSNSVIMNSNCSVTAIFIPNVNNAPTANPVLDQTITQPANSTSISGSGSDSDGSVTGYGWRWTGVGPATPSISFPSLSSTAITGLTAVGTYGFQFRVQDNDGDWSSWTNFNVTVAAASVMSGTLSSSSCTITSGQNNCSVSLNWTTLNPVSASSVTNNGGATPGSTSGPNGTQSFSVPYNNIFGGVTSFYLYNNGGSPLATGTVTTTCIGGTTWNGSICAAASQAPVTTLTPSSQTIANNTAATLNWTGSNSPTQCIAGGGSWSGFKNPTSGGSGSTPVLTSAGSPYTFTLRCDNATGSGNTASVIVNVSAGVQPSGNINVSNCTIAANQSSCNTTLNWSTSNLIAAPTNVTKDRPSINTFVSSAVSNSNFTNSVSFGTTQFFLIHNSATLSSGSTNATCANGTTWNGSICAAGASLSTFGATVTPFNITQTSATGGASITSDGGSPITVSGLVWSSSPNPQYVLGGPASGNIGQTTDDGWKIFNTAHAFHGPFIGNPGQTTNGWTSVGGPWISQMTGLSAGNTYFVRPYAVNGAGTAYGTMASFSTLVGGGGGPSISLVVNPPTVAMNGNSIGTLTILSGTARTCTVTGSPNNLAWFPIIFTGPGLGDIISPSNSFSLNSATATTNLSATCTDSSNRTSNVATALLTVGGGQIDLSTGNPITTTANTFNPVILQAPAYNNTSNTFGSISSYAFQVTDGPGGTGNVIASLTAPISSITANMNIVISSPSYTFNFAQTYSYRLCMDTTGVQGQGPNPIFTGNVITESNETNNCSTWGNVTVTNLLPNLTADFINNPNSFSQGVPNQFVGFLKNIGGGPAVGPFPYFFQVSTLPNGIGVLTDLSPAGSYSGTMPPGIANWTVSSPNYTFAASGTYYARVCNDKYDRNTTPLNDAINESDESDNCGPWTNINVIGAVGPDLTMSTPTDVSGNPAQGQNSIMSSSIRNIGNAGTGVPSVVSFERNTATQGTGTTSVISTQGVGILPALFGPTVLPFSYTWPSTGIWSVRACADSTNVVPEQDETNCSPWLDMNVGVPPVPTVSIVASVNPVPTLGGNTDITWSSARTDSCTKDFVGGSAISGSTSMIVSATPTKYNITCLQLSTSTQVSASVTVTVGTPILKKPLTKEN